MRGSNLTHLVLLDKCSQVLAYAYQHVWGMENRNQTQERQHVYMYNYVGASTTQTFDSEALSQEGKIAVASLITVFVVTSLLFFIIGF